MTRTSQGLRSPDQFAPEMRTEDIAACFRTRMIPEKLQSPTVALLVDTCDLLVLLTTPSCDKRCYNPRGQRSFVPPSIQPTLSDWMSGGHSKTRRLSWPRSHSVLVGRWPKGELYPSRFLSVIGHPSVSSLSRPATSSLNVFAH